MGLKYFIFLGLENLLYNLPEPPVSQQHTPPFFSSVHQQSHLQPFPDKRRYKSGCYVKFRPPNDPSHDSKFPTIKK